MHGPHTTAGYKRCRTTDSSRRRSNQRCISCNFIFLPVTSLQGVSWSLLVVAQTWRNSNLITLRFGQENVWRAVVDILTSAKTMQGLGLCDLPINTFCRDGPAYAQPTNPNLCPLSYLHMLYCRHDCQEKTPLGSQELLFRRWNYPQRSLNNHRNTVYPYDCMYSP